jgi:hypothetical protein
MSFYWRLPKFSEEKCMPFATGKFWFVLSVSLAEPVAFVQHFTITAYVIQKPRKIFNIQ